MAKCLVYETLNSVNEMTVKTSKDGLMTLSGVFGVCGVKNNNNRVYEKANYGKCVSILAEQIARDGGVPGELEHPQSMNITLENISHKITDIKIDENGVVTGTIQLLDTPKGQIAQKIVEGGLPLFVSSRAMGQVDKSGNVVLEHLATYDLVGSPGFSQARMHLNESQCFESITDNMCIISEKESNIEDMNNEEILEKLSALEARINDLESENQDLREQVENAPDFDLKALSEGIQKWIMEQYSPEIEKWIMNSAATQIRKDVMEHVAAGVQKWVMEQYSPEVEKWVLDQVAPEVEKWITENYSPEVEKWVLDQVAPGIQSWTEIGRAHV